MEYKKNWYVVYTKPKWEKKTASLLEKQGIEHYCPVHKVERQWSDRKKIIIAPLFTSYVFIYASKIDYGKIRSTGGVINFVYWLGQPAIIKDAEINAIKDFLLLHEKVKVRQMKVKAGDTVRIVNGPLCMQSGEIVAIKNRTVMVMLPSLGYMLMAEIEKVNVELVTLFKGVGSKAN